MYICERCRKPCFVEENFETNVEEFWGTKQLVESCYLTSDCCDKDVEDIHEETLVHQHCWAECRKHVLEHGEFPKAILSPLPEDGKISMEEVSLILDDEELAFLTRQCFKQEKLAA